MEGNGQTHSELSQVKTALDVLYDFNSTKVNDITPVPENTKTLAIIRPTDTINNESLDQLDKILEKGGNLFIALNKDIGDLNNAYGTGQEYRFGKMAGGQGLEVREDFVIDAQCASVGVQQRLRDALISLPMFLVYPNHLSRLQTIQLLV